MLKTILDLVEGSQAFLSDAELHHLVRVRRAREGEIFLGLHRSESSWYKCQLERGRKGWEIRILERMGSTGEPPFEIVLAAALVQKHCYEWVLQKSCELGVGEIVPLMSGYVAGWSRHKVEKLTPRWEKILVESVKQCGRSKVPILSGPVGVAEFLEVADGSSLLVLHPDQGAGLREVAEQLPRPEKLSLMIGPEGGWQEDELDLMKHAGARLVRLGPRVMRAETAVTAALSVVQSLWGDFSA